ncbi:CoB--CoM heterodisulfide reductase iron-sulfur subunit A family protein [bacterium]|nr:CoB--CoM heterodisulfide reductase iron-sulfur subunit A family protein [bacterium]
MVNPKRRVGVYICHCGGNISDVVDVQKVVEAAAQIDDVVVARREMFMCSDPGQKLISDDIEQQKLDRVVVAACSPSLHELTFRDTLKRSGLNPFLYEHVNIREQVSWCHKDDPLGATQKATRLVAAAIAKAKLLHALEPINVDSESSVAIIGGGCAGLRTAIELARSGFKVHIVERAPELGGHLARSGKVYPTDERSRDILAELIREVQAYGTVTLHTETEVVARAGYLGNFRITIRTKSGQTQELRVGAVVVATGFDDYQPVEGEFGWGLSERVITLPDLLERLDQTGPTGGKLTKDGQPVHNVAFIHCVGSRQVEGIHTPAEGKQLNQHCSRVCCTAALRTASELHLKFPDINIYDVYQDIRTYGRGHEDIYEAASRAGVIFLRYRPETPPQIHIEQDGGLSMSVVDTLSFGEELTCLVDLVVLVTGLVPRSIDSLIEMLKLPRSSDGFLQEIHPKLRPVEVNVPGVFIAGTCQAPMDIAETSAAASAAATKVSCLISRGQISLPPFVATINDERCDGCENCIVECAFVKAIALTMPYNKKVPVVNTAICKGCGMCVAACPHRAIDVNGWQIDQFEAMIDALATQEVSNV